MRRLLVPALLAIVSATGGAAIAVAAGPDPVLGTWQLNVSKSTFKRCPALKSQVRTYSQSGQMLTVAEDRPQRLVDLSTGAAGRC
jgi:hypothetical protein